MTTPPPPEGALCTVTSACFAVSPVTERRPVSVCGVHLKSTRALTMLVGERRSRCRQVTGPTPHSAAMIREDVCEEQGSKVALRVRAQQMTQRRVKQDDARDQAEDYSRELQTCDINNAWLESSERRFLRRTVDREVRDASMQHQSDVREKKRRLRAVLEAEERQLLKELEEKQPLLERQAQMRERVAVLREKRERERLQLVSDKLEQQFIQQCDELRTAQSKWRDQQLSLERAVQVRGRQERRQQQQQEERLFGELWAADRQAKEEREARRVQLQQQRNMEHLQDLHSQMEVSRQQMNTERQKKEEDDRFMQQQYRNFLLQGEQQEQQEQLQVQRRCQELDQCLRLKQRRLAREQEIEEQLERSIVQQQLQLNMEDKEEAARRKVELREEQLRYQEYLCEEQQRQRREEEEVDHLLKEKTKEIWDKKDEESRRKTEAKRRLMDEVMESRRLQVQRNINLEKQKQADRVKEREELSRKMEQMKLQDEEEERRKRQVCRWYHADLRAQVKHQQQLQAELRSEAVREQQQAKVQEQLYEQKRDQILSRTVSHSHVPASPGQHGCPEQ